MLGCQQHSQESAESRPPQGHQICWGKGGAFLFGDLPADKSTLVYTFFKLEKHCCIVSTRLGRNQAEACGGRVIKICRNTRVFPPDLDQALLQGVMCFDSRSNAAEYMNQPVTPTVEVTASPLSLSPPSFVPCSEKIHSAVTEMASLFPKVSAPISL